MIYLQKHCVCVSSSSGPRTILVAKRDRFGKIVETRLKLVRMACDHCDAAWRLK